MQPICGMCCMGGGAAAGRRAEAAPRPSRGPKAQGQPTPARGAMDLPVRCFVKGQSSAPEPAIMVRDVEEGDTIEQLRERIAYAREDEKGEYFPCEFLVFRGKKMEDGRTVSDYGCVDRGASHSGASDVYNMVIAIFNAQGTGAGSGQQRFAGSPPDLECGNLENTSVRRLKKELQKMSAGQPFGKLVLPPGASVSPVPPAGVSTISPAAAAQETPAPPSAIDITPHWQAIMKGPPDSPYSGGFFTIDIVFRKNGRGDSYPFAAPQVQIFFFVSLCATCPPHHDTVRVAACAIRVGFLRDQDFPLQYKR
eukprot:COSAG01_NODE_12502_length_1728_cov_2.548189_1_plen_309_part_00